MRKTGRTVSMYPPPPAPCIYGKGMPVNNLNGKKQMLMLLRKEAGHVRARA